MKEGESERERDRYRDGKTWSECKEKFEYMIELKW